MDAQLPDPTDPASSGPAPAPARTTESAEALGGSQEAAPRVEAPPETELEEATAPHTGVPGVDEALADLDAAQRLPLEEQVAVFEQTQRRLRGALDEPAPADPTKP